MKKMIITFVLLLMFSASAYAAEGGVVDLTDFAAGDSNTHSHVWEDKYDAESHWRECKLCGSKNGEYLHALSISYTMGEGSCSPANYKQTICSACNYLVRENAQGEHTFKSYYDYWKKTSEGVKLIYRPVCSACNNAYDSEKECRDVNGEIIDISTKTLPIDIYTENGELIKSLNYRYVIYEAGLGDFFETEYDLVNNNTQIKITTRIIVPETVLSAMSFSEVSTTSNYSVLAWFRYLDPSNSANSSFVLPLKEADENAKSMTFENTLDIKDFTEKSSALSNFAISLAIYDYNQNRTVSDIYRYAGTNIVILNSLVVPIPTITTELI